MKALSLSRLLGAIAALVPTSGLLARPPSEPERQGLTIIQTFEPQVRTSFDSRLPTFGDVRVIINVDSSGKLVDWLPVSYSHLEYYRAAVDALKEWDYKPATRGGEAIGVRQQVVFNFESRGQVVSLTNFEVVNALMGSAGQTSSAVKCVYQRGELDSLPKPTKVVQPLWVPAIDTLPPGAGVMVDFYIDETGRPRMPTVSGYTDPTVAIAAVHALEQWQFTVPTHRGRRVVVRAGQWFSFNPRNTTDTR